MSIEHSDGMRVNECRCDKCVRVFLWISDVAEKLEEKHRRARAVELQDRLEPIVRVVSNHDAEAVQILREDGRVALRAPLDDEAAVRGIIRLRMFDICASIGQRKENTMRKMLVEETAEAKESDELPVSDGHDETKEAFRIVLEALDPLDRMILWIRVVDAKTRREAEEFLGVSQKTVRYGEARAVNRIRSCLSGFEATSARASRGALPEPMLEAWTGGGKQLVAPLIGA